MTSISMNTICGSSSFSSNHTKDYFIRDAVEERQSPKSQLGVRQLLGVLFVGTVGGAYGMEGCLRAAGPLGTLASISILPWLWGFPAALAVAELATAVPSNAGPIMWINVALPRWMTMLSVQWTVLLDVIDNSLYPNLFVEYLGRVTNIDPASQVLLQLILIGGAAVLNVLGLEHVSNSNNLLMFITLLPFLLLFLCEIPHLDGKHWMDTPPTFDWRTFLPLISWNFSGFENAGHVVEEVAVPGKTLVRSLILLLLLSQAVYILPVLAGMII